LSTSIISSALLLAGDALLPPPSTLLPGLTTFRSPPVPFSLPDISPLLPLSMAISANAPLGLDPSVLSPASSCKCAGRNLNCGGEVWRVVSLLFGEGTSDSAGCSGDDELGVYEALS